MKLARIMAARAQKVDNEFAKADMTEPQVLEVP